jgi:hypothetical protein
MWRCTGEVARGRTGAGSLSTLELDVPYSTCIYHIHSVRLGYMCTVLKDDDQARGQQRAKEGEDYGLIEVEYLY